jgi:simple sugar transport system permease protein
MRYRAFVLSVALCSLLLLSAIHATRTPTLILLDWVRNAAPLVPLSLAAGLIISCGKIDIASGTVFGLAGMLIVAWSQIATTLTPGFLFFGCVIACVVSLLFYVLMYLLIVKCRVPALLCTLGIAFCARSLALVLQAVLSGLIRTPWTNSRPLGNGSTTVPHHVGTIVSNACLVVIPVLVALMALWRYRLDGGLEHISLGMNLESASIAGINTSRIFFIAFCLSGVFVGISAVLFLLGVQGGGWSADIGWGKELLAIAAAVLGGCRITGGRFDPTGIALATVLLYALRFTVTSFDLPLNFEYLVLGASLILVAVTDIADERNRVLFA